MYCHNITINIKFQINIWNIDYNITNSNFGVGNWIISIGDVYKPQNTHTQIYIYIYIYIYILILILKYF